VNQSAHSGRPDLTGIALNLAFIGGLAIASFWIMRPFLLALVWAATIVITTWPILEAAEQRFGGRRAAAAGLMTLGLLLVFLLPLALAIGTVASNYDAMAGLIRSMQDMTLPAAPQWLGGLPFVGDKLTNLWEEVSTAGVAWLIPYARQALGWIGSHIGDAGGALLHIVLTLLISGILYAQGDTAARGVRLFCRRLAGDRGDRAAVLAAQAVRGVALGVVVTAMAQASLGGLGLLVTGVPFAGPLSMLMFVLCLAQLGPLLVLVPAVIWMYWSGEGTWATVLLVVTVVVGTMDNFLRPWLIKKGADLPMLLIFAGVIGGLIGIGLIGVIVGPVVLAVTYRLLGEWVAGGAAPSASPSPSPSPSDRAAATPADAAQE
jgi:predicted PurR-regulated permease PerM